MKVIICANTETIQPIWNDVFEQAEVDPDTWAEECAQEWLDVFHGAVMDLGYDYDYDRQFRNWHGGPYSGHYHCPAEIDAQVREAQDKADQAARAKAAKFVAYMEGEAAREAQED